MNWEISFIFEFKAYAWLFLLSILIYVNYCCGLFVGVKVRLRLRELVRRESSGPKIKRKVSWSWCARILSFYRELYSLPHIVCPQRVWEGWMHGKEWQSWPHISRWTTWPYHWTSAASLRRWSSSSWLSLSSTLTILTVFSCFITFLSDSLVWVLVNRVLVWETYSETLTKV